MELKDFQYDLEIGRAVREIKTQGAKTVCVQLPEGIKPLARDIVREIEAQTDATVLVWLGSCYGACDVPPVESLGVDLLIAWGHSAWQA